MRKFFAAAIAVLAALFLLPVLLVRNEPLVGVGMSEIPEGAEKVGGRVSFEPSPSPGVSVEPSAEPSVKPAGAIAVLAEIDEEPETESEAGEDVATTICVVGEGEMALEDYVAGVVAAEMGPSFPTEARRAQAVAARSLALYRVNHPKHGDAAVCLDASCCMAWKTPDEGALDAAKSTEGVVATYDGEPIMAAFFSGSDGATLSAAEVWGGGVPYLVSVSSPWEGGGSIRGHGVGMSQYGAAGMADDGADYDEILRHFYTGIEVG